MRDDTLITDQETRAGNDGGQAPVAGWSVPGYTGLKALGSGGFGDVVLARHDESGTLVADAPQVQRTITVILVPQYRGISSSFSR